MFGFGRSITWGLSNGQKAVKYTNQILSPWNYKSLKLWKIGWTPDVTISEFTLHTHDVGSLRKRATDTMKFINFFFMLKVEER